MKIRARSPGDGLPLRVRGISPNWREQLSANESNDREQKSEQCDCGTLGMAYCLCDQQEGRQKYKHERYTPMKLVEAGFQPEVEVVFDFASCVGVSAIFLRSAGVAAGGGSAVTNKLARGVALHADEMSPSGTFPAVEAVVVAESREFILIGAFVRMFCQFFQEDGNGQEKNRVG
jgi:hypothetical protein